MKTVKRCEWATSDHMIKYHDTEWGVPVHDDQPIFEFLILEGAQAGLSWDTILKKRSGYRRAFSRFSPKKIAAYTKRDINRLLKDASIVRNRLKIEATINNAQRFLEVKQEFGTFNSYIWGFTNNKVIKNKFKSLDQIPATSKQSDALSKDLKQRGFKFVGSTIVYAHMQATGMVNDHITTCFRYNQV